MARQTNFSLHVNFFDWQRDKNNKSNSLSPPRIKLIDQLPLNLPDMDHQQSQKSHKALLML
jgi:hypothetical protein